MASCVSWFQVTSGLLNVLLSLPEIFFHVHNWSFHLLQVTLLKCYFLLESQVLLSLGILPYTSCLRYIHVPYPLLGIFCSSSCFIFPMALLTLCGRYGWLIILISHCFSMCRLLLGNDYPISDHIAPCRVI